MKRHIRPIKDSKTINLPFIQDRIQRNSEFLSAIVPKTSFVRFLTDFEFMTGGPKQFPCPICPKVMVNPETLQNHIKNVHHKNGQTKSNNQSAELTQNAKLDLLSRSDNPNPGEGPSEKQPVNDSNGLTGGLPSSSAIAGLDSRYSLLNYPFFHPGPC